MSRSKNVLRLNMPQWQGGDLPGYRIGGKVLAAIVPDAGGPIETVEVPEVPETPRLVDQGITSRAAVLRQSQAAREAIDRHLPDAIVTLGGDCLVDLAPIAYLNERYDGDLAILWIDAHPDVLSARQHPNAHAHVLALLLGDGAPEFVDGVSQPLRSDQILYVGLAETSAYETDFIKVRNISVLSPDDLSVTIEPVLMWLRQTGARHVAVHFDLDVLDPADYDFLYFRDPAAAPGAFDHIPKGSMKWEQVSSLLEEVARDFDLVGLAITEYLPWSVIDLARKLRGLPLLARRSDET